MRSISALQQPEFAAVLATFNIECFKSGRFVTLPGFRCCKTAGRLVTLVDLGFTGRLSVAADPGPVWSSKNLAVCRCRFVRSLGPTDLRNDRTEQGLKGQRCSHLRSTSSGPFAGKMPLPGRPPQQRAQPLPVRGVLKTLGLKNKNDK